MSPGQIGKYVVKRFLGGGGMGDVYLAHDPDLRQFVALKILKETFQDNAEIRERFAQEARAVERLRHQNVIKIHETGEADGRPYMAMEYIAGETLAHRMNREPPLTLASCVALIDDLCSGLAHAHAAGVIHRDIKPSNIMVDGNEVLTILDFGIARLGDSGMTRQGDVMGSEAYMSPEQMAGLDVDCRTDIFAMGALAYDLLASQQASGVRAADALLHRLRHDDLLILCPSLPGDLVALVMRALARRPEDRFSSIEEARGALHEVRRNLGGAVLEPTIVRPRAHTDKPSHSGRSMPVVPNGGSSNQGRDTSGINERRAPWWQELLAPRGRTAAVLAALAVVGVVAVGVPWLTADDESSSPSTNVEISPKPDDRPVLPGGGAGTNEELEEELTRITILLEGDDMGAAMERIVAVSGTTNDSRVNDLAERVALKALESMSVSEGAAIRQKASDLSPGSFATANRAKASAREALERAAFIEAGRQALNASRGYSRAETEARSEAARRTEAARRATEEPPRPTQPASPVVPVEVIVEQPTRVTPPPIATRTSGDTSIAPPSDETPIVPPRPSAPRPPAVSPLEREGAGIVAAMKRYEGAYRAMNVRAIGEIYPSLPREERQTLERNFRNCRSYDVAFANLKPSFGDDETQATVTVSTTYVCTPKTGQPPAADAVQDVFTLRKIGESWIIESRGTLN